ncbi:hypothetical protein [Piscinibacter koreensis]|uniref:Uncharacterized protein n=1 Tax=Piscinibacter koreensis TaxID=2742824 RepID=A0A7Y6TVZ1_9BURK|nr:hypothetical protein [Schlegelella koreensis]NUZ05599.1 hypothetical protein [Schlegelella koreensis]
MPRPDDDTLKTLLPLLRQLREIKGVREARPGAFTVRGASFINLQAEAGQVWAEMKKAGGAGFDRYPLATPPEHRKLVDDARRRAAALDDE